MSKVSEDADEQRYLVGKDGIPRHMPPPGLSARQRLEWANDMARREHARRAASEALVAISDLPMSREAFDSLPPRQKLEIANAITAKRRAV